MRTFIYLCSWNILQFCFVLPTEFGWNIYFDPEHVNRKKYEIEHSLEEKSTVSSLQHMTTVVKEKDSSSNEDSEDSNSSNLLNYNIYLSFYYLSIFLSILLYIYPYKRVWGVCDSAYFCNSLALNWFAATWFIIKV